MPADRAFRAVTVCPFCIALSASFAMLCLFSPEFDPVLSRVTALVALTGDPQYFTDGRPAAYLVGQRPHKLEIEHFTLDNVQSCYACARSFSHSNHLAARCLMIKEAPFGVFFA